MSFIWNLYHYNAHMRAYMCIGESNKMQAHMKFYNLGIYNSKSIQGLDRYIGLLSAYCRYIGIYQYIQSLWWRHTRWCGKDMGESSVCALAECNVVCHVVVFTAAVWPATPTWKLKPYFLINAYSFCNADWSWISTMEDRFSHQTTRCALHKSIKNVVDE